LIVKGTSGGAHGRGWILQTVQHDDLVDQKIDAVESKVNISFRQVSVDRRRQLRETGIQIGE